MRAPTVVPASPAPVAPLPERVTIYEVGPRDGLQNEKALVPTEVKAEFVERLLDAGLPIVEATSFVHPKWVPQLADAGELMVRLGERGRDLPVLVPNERGLDRALELGARHIAIFGSATETFAQRNLNRSLDEQFTMFEPVVKRKQKLPKPIQPICRRVAATARSSSAGIVTTVPRVRRPAPGG